MPIITGKGAMLLAAGWTAVVIVLCLGAPQLVRRARRWRWRRVTQGARRAVEVGAYEVAERRLLWALKRASGQDQRRQAINGLSQLIEIYHVHGRGDRAER